MCGVGGTTAGLWLMLIPLLVFLVGGLVALSFWAAHTWPVRSAPEGKERLLRGHYAAGVISRQQYQDALLDMLKDRYVRGALRLEEYEARVARLFAPPEA